MYFFFWYEEESKTFSKFQTLLKFSNTCTKFNNINFKLFYGVTLRYKKGHRRYVHAGVFRCALITYCVSAGRKQKKLGVSKKTDKLWNCSPIFSTLLHKKSKILNFTEKTNKCRLFFRQRKRSPLTPCSYVTTFFFYSLLDDCSLKLTETDDERNEKRPIVPFKYFS